MLSHVRFWHLADAFTNVEFRAATIAPWGQPQAMTTKGAINYLISSGATAISIVENATGCTFRLGTKFDAAWASLNGMADGPRQTLHELTGSWT